MKAERLLALIERVDETPDAVPRLRRLGLDLAVRGRLVQQDPMDTPASELLNDIAEEKARLVKAGERRKKIAGDPEIVGTPFDLPNSWAWFAIGTVFLYDAGIKREPIALDRPLWLLELEDIEKDTGRLVSKVRSAERASKEKPALRLSPAGALSTI